MATGDPTTVVGAFCSGQFCEVIAAACEVVPSGSGNGLKGVRVGEGASNPGPPTRRSAKLYGRVRRGSVVEVAPNIVDATAVDLSDVMDGENDLSS